MNNQDTRTKARESEVKLWQIADWLNIHDTNFSKKLRHELPQEEKEKIFSIIDELAKGVE